MEEELQCYLVGGAVRDELLGRVLGDRDWVVVGSTPEQMIALGFTQVGRDFPVFLHPDSHEEYALARTERKQGKGHRGFVVDADRSVTLEEDLLRRDLTINAIAQAPDGALIDPFGGAVDLANRRFKHVSDAFAEDPLRVFRVARFAAQLPEFSVAPETSSLMRVMCTRGDLQSLSAERVWQETAKALGAADPHRFFEVLGEVEGLTDWFVEIVVDDLDFKRCTHRQDAPARFAELPLDGKSFQALAARLKAPSQTLQCALDRVAWAEVVRMWRTVPATQLSAAFDAMKVAHDLVRVEWLIDWLGEQQAGEFAGLRVLALGYKTVPMPAGEYSGAAYGQALRQARMAWLDEQR